LICQVSFLRFTTRTLDCSPFPFLKGTLEAHDFQVFLSDSPPLFQDSDFPSDANLISLGEARWACRISSEVFTPSPRVGPILQDFFSPSALCEWGRSSPSPEGRLVPTNGDDHFSGVEALQPQAGVSGRGLFIFFFPPSDVDGSLWFLSLRFFLTSPELLPDSEFFVVVGTFLFSVFPAGLRFTFDLY